MSKAKVIFSEGFEDIKDGNSNGIKIINPLVEIALPFLPTTYTFGLTIMLSDLPKNENVNLEVIIFSPDEREVLRLEQQNFPTLKNIVANIDLKNVAFYTGGNYIVKVLINNKEVLDDSISVVLADQERGVH